MTDAEKDMRIMDLTQAADMLRRALWDILYADQDNAIPDDLHIRARRAVIAYDKWRRAGSVEVE